MGKIEINKRIKKQKILHAALLLFTTKGITETSISDIMKKAGLAKGTFYLYFKDKYDVRNQLVSIESSHLFQKADEALQKTDLSSFEDKIIFIVDYVLDLLSENKQLTSFIAKNLSWGIFKYALMNTESAEATEPVLDFYSIYQRMLDDSPHELKNPEVLLFMIIELVGSTCYSCILYNEPMGIEEYKPYLYQTVRDMINGQMITSK